jgi:hypothetical protein
VREEVRVPVGVAPTERVAVEDLVGVIVKVAVLLEEGVGYPELVVVMDTLVVPVVVKEGV